MDNLTLVIPAKNESDSLPKVLDEIKNFSCKKIVVLEENDQETIKSITPHEIKILFQTGKGYGNAIRAGINNVSTDYLCIFNADGSFDPNDLIELLKKCQSYDFVFASRYLKNGGSKDDTILTKFGNFFFFTNNFKYS